MSPDRSITDAARDIFEIHAERWRTGPEDLGSLFDECAEQGWHLLAIPEEHGGLGGTVRDLVGVLMAAGGSGVSVPIAEAHGACHAARISGAGMSEETAAGHVGAGLVIGDGQEEDGRHRVLVPWGRHFRAAYVLAAGGPSLLPLTPADLSLGENLVGEPWDVMERAIEADGTAEQSTAVLTRWTLLSCAKVVGAAKAVAELTVSYANTRVQFGKPLVKFQGVSTLVADVLAATKLAEASLDHALCGVDAESPHTTAAVSAAKVVCSTVAGDISRKAHQVHGAIGVTREHGLHRYTRRLWAWRDELGSEDRHVGVLGNAVAEGGEEALWELTGQLDAAGFRGAPA
ncbi:acyl-CoA dehydrogenase family protein [Actinophytocola sp.]|uniref:acyl-CoA dehydrogenase family protein n=1 Tax=Actinophytocola sp. TaxID=1872138 RepID=UPI0025C01FA8|nr:acyl-CoA dehydrogenase family protein [Actinophytocola sp.]